MQRAFGTVLVAVLVVLTGCSGILGGGGENGAVETLTPAAVPTDKPTPTPPPKLAPGLTGAGVENASAIAAAHNAVLENRSYTILSNRTVRDANGTLIYETVGISRVEPTNGQFASTWNSTGTPLWVSAGTPVVIHHERYSDDERTLSAYTLRNGTTRYQTIAPESDSSWRASLLQPGDTYLSLLPESGTRITDRVAGENRTRYRVSAVGFEPWRLSASGLIDAPWNTSLSAVIDSRGFVHEHHVRYRGTMENGTVVTITESARYTNIGNTTIERPPWYDEAMNRTTPIAEETATTSR